MIRKWRVGDIWKANRDVEFLVKSVRSDGVAELQMVWPYLLSKTNTQAHIPSYWKLKKKAQTKLP